MFHRGGERKYDTVDVAGWLGQGSEITVLGTTSQE